MNATLRTIALAAATLICRSHIVQSQQAAALELPLTALHTIAVDIDEGRNPVYCYFGVRLERPSVLVRVDSVRTVGTAGECAGVGIAFVMRMTDRALLAHLLRGVIDGSPRFAVVSAFYRVEDIECDGVLVRAARALSVVRGGVSAVVRGGA